MEKDGILVSGSKLYVSNHLYIYFYCYHYFYYYSYQYGSLRIKVCIFKITQQEKSQVTYFQNYSTQESFSLTAPIDKKHILENPHHSKGLPYYSTNLTLCFYLSYLLGPEFFPLRPALDLWFRGHLESLLGTLSFCPPIIFSIAFVPAHHLAIWSHAHLFSAPPTCLGKPCLLL